MTFHTQQNFNNTKKESWIDKFTSQAHQLFFVSAVVFALLVMLLTILSLQGVDNLPFHIVHNFGLNYAVFTNAFLGFLITVIPKYTHSTVIEKKEYLYTWSILQLSIILTLIGFETIGKVAFALVIFYINYIFYKTIHKGKAPNKKESYILNILLFIGASLLLCEVTFEQNLSVLIFFGYLLALVFVVAQKMVPNFYSGQMQIPQWNKPKYILEISLLLFFCLGISLQFEMVLFFKLSSFLSMLFFGYVIFNLNIYKKSPPILAILVLAFVWLEIGFVVLFIESLFELHSLKLSLHIFAIGFITNLLIGFGSRVTLGHAVPAQKIFADNITLFLFVFIQIVLISRILASVLFLFDLSSFIDILYLSSGLWIVLFTLWFLRYGKILLRVK